MTLLLPAGLLALLLAVPVLILHMLTPRRPATPVSSLIHWDGLRHSITAAEPWQKLRWSLLLFLQLLAVALLAFALARPATIEQTPLAGHTVFIIDTSASMASIDGEPDRLGSAVAKAKELRLEIPDGGAASVVIGSRHPSILVSEIEDTAEFDRALDGLRATGGSVDFEATFALAESLVSAERDTGFILLSDGQLNDIEQALAPLGTRYIPMGEADTNRAVTGLSVNAGPGGLQATVTVESTGGPDATQTLRLDVDGITVVTEQIEIPRGQIYEETFELPNGSRVAAFLDGEDLLALDNQRYVAAPVVGALKARIHGESTFFVEQLLTAMPEIDANVGVTEEVDFEIYVGVPLPAQPAAPFIAIDVPGGAPGITPAGRVDNPIPTLVATDPLLEDIDVSRLAIAEAQAVTVSRGEVLLGAPGAPLIVAGEVDGVPFYYLAFTLEQSNLPINIAFPIIGARMVGGLAAAEGATGSLVVGDVVPVPPGGATVYDPRGNASLIGFADSAPIADQAGFWRIEAEGSEPAELAVNVAGEESDLGPVTSLPGIRPAVLDGDEEANTATIARSLLPWVLGAVLIVLAVEYFVSYRSRGVSARQWRWGTIGRVVMVALVTLALVNPTVTATSERVNTAFVVDMSASMGSGYEQARAWVESAVTEADDAEWAIVEFGAAATVATPMGTDPYRPSRGMDAEATSIARGLRLGESVLTGETRQRIVLISDGRTNSGDLQAELDRLETLGVSVDVHTVIAEQQTDAAIAGIDLPNTVNENETFEATVEVLSTISGQAVVTLVEEDSTVGTQTVDLTPGVNHITFPVEASASGLQKLEARVAMQGDAVGQNDTAVNAVEVVGPATVLIVEGLDADGSVLDDLLTSKGVADERIGVADLPGLQELSRYRAVMLVDVSARDLSDEKMTVLNTYVRDLGRGLIVVGGTHSFGLGGYRDTVLEALLPVDSEATDAKREAEVAEVLLIDTSESMGACHCAENGEFSEEGGINKTDISKAAAIRAIEALGANDEIGLLAFAGTSEWVIPLQAFPDRTTIEEGVGSLRPFGETRIVPAIKQAATALRASDKELKHIILFTDGFTVELDVGADFQGDPFHGNLIEEVETLAEEGITVSVVGTGEGAIPQLELVAEAGNGRFYPGRDLNEIPEIFVKEARIAARSFINEGEFYPAVTSTAEAVRDLASSPALLGYVATSAKPTADIQLQVGEFADPLLASWRVGLGKVTVWTSDAGDKWAANWAGWDGYADFWSDLVRDTFPLSGSEGQQVSARISEGLMTVKLESSDPFPSGTDPKVRVSYPDGTGTEVRLDRVNEFEFSAVVPARTGGSYAVGASFESDQGETVVMSAVATRSFAAEYLPGESDTELMASISSNTGGRGEILSSQAFDPDGLDPGVTEKTYRWWFLLAAALLWPIDVALRRLRFGRREPLPPLSPPEGHPTTPTKPAASRTP